MSLQLVSGYSLLWLFCIDLNLMKTYSVSWLAYRPQTTVGTAMILCHRFFVRRSHACHDRFVSFSSLVLSFVWLIVFYNVKFIVVYSFLLQLIATATLFLAAKSEETARPLNDVLRASCEITHKQDLTVLSYLLPSVSTMGVLTPLPSPNKRKTNAVLLFCEVPSWLLLKISFHEKCCLLMKWNCLIADSMVQKSDLVKNYVEKGK